MTAPAPFGGAHYLLRGFGLIRTPALRHYVLWPLALTGGLWLALAVLALRWAGRLLDALGSLLPEGFGWLAWLLWPLLILTLLVVAAYGFVAVANLVAAPFNAALARAVERLVSPKTARPPQDDVLIETLRCVRSELRKLLYFAAIGLPLLAALWIPGVNLIAGPLWLLWGAWLVSLEYLDFPAGNHGLGFAQVRAAARRTPGTALAFGALTLLLLSVPLLNLLVMPAAVAGATLWWAERLAPHGGAP